MVAHRTPPRRAGEKHWVRLWLGQLCVLGTVLLVLTAAVIAIGPIFGLTTIRLATGSMSPGLPANSLLLVQHTPASEVEAGDIVTVQRPDHRPVTHRVMTVEPSQNPAKGTFALTLRGDGNTVNDPQPYLVDSVGRMLIGIPTGGQLVTVVSTPAGMSVVTALLGVLTLWVLWPGQHRVLPSAEVPRS